MTVVRFVVPSDGGGFDVIEGVRLNDWPLSRLEADALRRGLPPSPKFKASAGKLTRLHGMEPWLNNGFRRGGVR